MIRTNDYCLKIIILDKKMGCICSKFDEPKIKIYDCTLPGEDFEFLKPNGTITFRIDRKYNIPVVHIKFDGWYENGSSRPWQKHTE